MTLDRAVEETPALKEMYRQDERVKELIGVARRLEGVTRHASVHAAGVVIAPRPLTEFAPLYKSQKDEITTQWAMKEIERVGLLKMDFLGLSTLTLLHDAVAHIHETTGTQLSLDQIPLDDPKTYELFSDGQTLGVFQFESSGMRETLRKAKPKRFDDLIALKRPLSPRPAPRRRDRRLYCPQAWQSGHRVRSLGARADSRGHLRRYRLSGTGHAHRQRSGRVHHG